MTKILFQGDDFGFTRGVTLGIVDSIDRGVLRNTGLFANIWSMKTETLLKAVSASEIQDGKAKKEEQNFSHMRKSEKNCWPSSIVL